MSSTRKVGQKCRITRNSSQLQSLKVARLTHAFHCCAFKYPEQHNPSRYAQVAEEHRRTCQQYQDLDTGQFLPKIARIRKKRLAFKDKLSVAASFRCGFDIQKRHRDPISSNNQSQDTNSKSPFPLLTRVDRKDKDTNYSNNFNNDVYV
ncbi:hypothetical protein WA026_015693 [Henosepilachna vigintioctopunctata]|uniref:Uncharacterized protein n=1 Tax=Henosepilachna vigintioctopunctata TaxID=420089 RepID=A0AAW1URL4_9CUCU